MKSNINSELFKFSLLEPKYTETIISGVQKLGSITPRTHNSREIPKEQENLYVDKYEYKDNTVTHYAIDVLKIKINPNSEQLLNEPTLFFDASEKIISDKNSDKSKKTSSSKSSKYTKEEAKNISHHSLEQEVLTKALTHILETDNRCVLVDIFAREKEKIKISLSKDSQEHLLETHTVILYKNPFVNGKHKITVIDPSNFTFSSHLAGKDIKFKHTAFDGIVTAHKTSQIYKPDNKNIGSGNDQYRDCTDIAVKLAFSLSKAEWSNIDPEKAVEYNIIKEISNNPDIDKNIIDKDYATRIKQASDVRIIREFNAIESKINNTIKKVLSLNLNDYYTGAKTQHQDILKKTNYEDILESLLYFSKNIDVQLISELGVQLHEEQVKLQGTLENIKAQI